MAKAMVVAYQEAADVQLTAQDVADELFGRELAHRLGEVNQEAGIHLHLLQLGEARLQRVDELKVEVGLHHLARMVGERHHRTLHAVGTGFLLEVLQQELMSAVHTIEEPDRCHTGGSTGIFLI